MIKSILVPVRGDGMVATVLGHAAELANSAACPSTVATIPSPRTGTSIDFIMTNPSPS